MRLRELRAEFLRLDPTNRNVFRKHKALEGADGVMFLCTRCFEKSGGPVGVHSIICWFAGRVPDELSPKPGRWNPAGTGVEDLSFVPPGATSVAIVGSCGWHGFVQNGSAA